MKINKLFIVLFMLFMVFFLFGCENNKAIDAESMEITGEKTGEVGQSISLDVVLTPIDASLLDINWSSDNETIATVSNDGVVSLLAPGTVKITAIMGDISSEFEIIISEGIEITITGQKKLQVGETCQLTCVTNSNEDIAWTSSNEDLATVDDNGLVTALAVGTAEINAAVGGNLAHVTIEITAKEINYTLSISGDDDGFVGDTLALTADTNLTDTLTWTSSDTTIATVDDLGEVTLISEGSVTITVTGGELSDSIEITVATPIDYVAFIGDTGYETLVEAVMNAQAGDKIKVAAGTYSDNLVINKSITVQGPNSSIDPNSGVRKEEAILTGIINIAGNTDGVTLKGLAFTSQARIYGESSDGAINNFMFINNYIYDTSEATEEWSPLRNYDNEAFMDLGAQGNLLNNVEIKNNKFENVSMINIYVACANGLTISNNSFHNFDRDAVRLDGGYCFGNYMISGNVIENDELGAYNGIYFRATGGNMDAYGTPNAQNIILTENIIKNVGQIDTNFSGAISTSSYQEYGLTITATYNVIEKCSNGMFFRNNASATNHEAYKWVCKVNYNTFIGEPNAYYLTNMVSAGESTETNPAIIDFESNLFKSSDDGVINNIDNIKGKVQGAKDFTTILMSDEELAETKPIDIYIDTIFMDYDDGASVNYNGQIVTVGTNAFAMSLLGLSQAEDGDTVYFAPGIYPEDIIIDKELTLFGANYNVNPNIDVRVEGTILQGDVKVNANNVTVNGFNISNAQIVAATTGVDNLVVINNVFEDDCTFNLSTKGQVELVTDDVSVFFNNVTVSYNLFKANSGQRNTKIVATQVKDFTAQGNVMYGASQGIYDDCFKFYTPTNYNTVGIQGEVLVENNKFYDIGQYTIWFKTYSDGKYEIYNNYFENVGKTESDGATTYWRGVLTMNVPTAIESTVEVFFMGNEINGSNGGVRLPNGSLTAEQFVAKVNDNIFEGILQSEMIITESPSNVSDKSALTLVIDAKNNYYDVALDDSMFYGVSDYTTIYTDKEQVPAHVSADEILPTSITINNTEEQIISTEPLQLDVVLNSEATYTGLVYTSSDENIATISKGGLVSVVGPGTVTITVSCKADSSINNTYELKAIVFEVENPHYEIAKDATYQIVMNILPDETANQIVSYTSSDSAIATVSATGLVTAVTGGIVDIEIVSNYYTGVKINLELEVTNLSEVEVNEKIDSLLSLLSTYNVSEVEHNNNVQEIGYQATYTVDLYGSVNKFYFGDKSINTSITTPLTNDNRPGTKKPSIEYICIHDTGSTAASAGAASHASYVQNGGGGTSWSYTVGNDGIYFQIPETEVTYHAGDGTRPFALEASGVSVTVSPSESVVALNSNGYYTINGVATTLRPYKIVNGVESLDMTNYKTSQIVDMGIHIEEKDGQYYLGKTWYSSTYDKVGNYGGNMNSIGIETCVNNGSNLWQTWHMVSYLAASLALKYDLPLNRVVNHHFFSGKECPQTMRTAGYWDDVMLLVAAEYAVAKDYSDCQVTMVSGNPDLVNNSGLVIGSPTVDTTVSYTITVTNSGISKSVTLSSLVPADN